MDKRDQPSVVGPDGPDEPLYPPRLLTDSRPQRSQIEIRFAVGDRKSLVVDLSAGVDECDPVV